jgi:hypothetical protein
MRVGVAREAKRGERRVALTPAGAREIHRDGHEVVKVGADRAPGQPTRTMFPQDPVSSVWEAPRCNAESS